VQRIKNNYRIKTNATAMSILGIDLGGTKLAAAVFTAQGDVLSEETTPLEKRSGAETGALLLSRINELISEQKEKRNPVQSIGIAVPGISYKESGTVWAPNIPGWEAFPLEVEIRKLDHEIPFTIDSDRTCYMLGERWKGVARDCTDAIYLAVGTGIGAGILVNGQILRGANDIAGAIGWMALERPFNEKYIECGCFESSASGEGIVKKAMELLKRAGDYQGLLKSKMTGRISAYDIFDAYDKRDQIAMEVITHCIETWGMAIANLVSLFNPQKIILGGGVFGPAVRFIPLIREQASRWAQPISMKKVIIEPSLLGRRAGLFGAAWLSMQNNKAQA
jgi:glucokinase